MLRILGAISIVVTIVLIAVGVITIYDESLQIGRMWETPVVRLHEKPLPVMDTRTVPFHGGEMALRQSDPNVLTAPFDLGTTAVIKAGQVGYQRYCAQCHGKHFDGMGTVGQSFAPLPGDLRSPKVQGLAEGVLFHEISYGIPGGRQPALASTIGVDERWHIIGFIKSLGVR